MRANNLAFLMHRKGRIKKSFQGFCVFGSLEPLTFSFSSPLPASPPKIYITPHAKYIIPLLLTPKGYLSPSKGLIGGVRGPGLGAFRHCGRRASDGIRHVKVGHGGGQGGGVVDRGVVVQVGFESKF